MRSRSTSESKFMGLATAAPVGQVESQLPPGDPLTPLLALTRESSWEAQEAALRAFANRCAGLDKLGQTLARAGGIRILTSLGMTKPALVIDAALPPPPTPVAATEHQIELQDPDPWPDPVDGAGLLDAIAEVFQRWVVLPKHAAVALALWVVFTHAIESFDCAPYLCLSSPVKRCGKGRTLDPLRLLVPRALPCASTTTAALYRAIELWQPTLIIDEAEGLFRGRGSSSSKCLREILDAGHTRTTAYVLRCDSLGGEFATPRRFSVWCAKAFALIGSLPSTLADRSIVIKMRRKGAGEIVARFSELEARDELGALCRQAVRWAQDHADELRASRPASPELGNDRAVDSWEPLMAIADLAGARWPTLAREAAVALTETEADSQEIGEMLLGDIQALFDTQRADRLASAVLCKDLAEREDRPWAEWKSGRALTPVQLAGLLRPFGVKPVNLKMGRRVVKGYYLSSFLDAFGRYSPSSPIQSATPLRALNSQWNPKERPATAKADIQSPATRQLVKKEGELPRRSAVAFGSTQQNLSVGTQAHVATEDADKTNKKPERRFS